MSVANRESLAGAEAGGIGIRSAAAARGQPAEEPLRSMLRFAVLEGPVPLCAWQRGAVASLAATEGVLQQDALLAAERSLAPLEPRLDFILSFAPVSAGRALMRAARLGVWQFWFGDWA
ncbi:MAG: hypothetical protein ACRET2_10420, partial [Steroidobacteraceae bacterium]